jgi:hypothetical protein
MCVCVRACVRACVPIPVAARSKAEVCGRLVTGVAGSNPAWGMDVCLLCLYVVLSCVGRGLCDGLITRPEEYVCTCVWSRNREKGGQRSFLDYKHLWINYIYSLPSIVTLVLKMKTVCEISDSHGGESFIALMTEAVRTSETSVYSNQTTRRYILEGSNLHGNSTFLRNVCNYLRVYMVLQPWRTTSLFKQIVFR